MRYILLILVLFLSGCTVTNGEFELATAVCKDFGGLRYYSPYGEYARCNNGIVVKHLHRVNVSSE